MKKIDSSLLNSKHDSRFEDMGSFEENFSKCKSENANFYTMYALFFNDVAIEVRNKDDYNQVVKLSHGRPLKIVSASEDSHKDFVSYLFERNDLENSIGENGPRITFYLSATLIGCLIFCAWMHYH